MSTRPMNIRPLHTALWSGIIGLALLVTAVLGTATAQSNGPTELTVLVPAEFPNIDPCETISGDQSMVKYHVYSRLYTFNENMEPEPDLVVNESISDDGTTWTFDLREDVTFHDGTPVDAEAVKYTLDRMAERDCGQQALYEPIADYRVESPTRIVMETDGLFPALRNNLAHPDAAIINPTADQELGDEFGLRPVGSGPYEFEEWETGDHLSLVRNPDYYGNAPYFERIDFQFVLDDTTRAISMETGEADVGLRILPTDVERLEQAPGLEVGRIIGRSMFYPINVTREPFDDPRVRRAMNHAVDKEAIIERVLFGAGTPSNSLVEAVQYTIDAGYYEYDPDRARELLTEAGAEGASVEVLSPTSRYPSDVEVSQAVAGFLREVGLDVSVNAISDWPSYVSRVEQGNFDMFMIGWGGSTGDPDNAFRRLLHSDHAGRLWNPGGFSDPEVDELIEEGGSAFDTEVRAEAYADLQEHVWEAAPWLFMFRAATFLVHDENITGIKVLPGTEMPYFWEASRSE